MTVRQPESRESEPSPRERGDWRKRLGQIRQGFVWLNISILTFLVPRLQASVNVCAYWVNLPYHMPRYAICRMRTAQAFKSSDHSSSSSSSSLLIGPMMNYIFSIFSTWLDMIHREELCSWLHPSICTVPVPVPLPVPLPKETCRSTVQRHDQH